MADGSYQNIHPSAKTAIPFPETGCQNKQTMTTTLPIEMTGAADAPTMPPLYSSGKLLDPAHLGWLRSSIDLLDRPEALRQRMAEEGYLFLPGLLDRDEVFEARREIVRRLAEVNYLKPGSDPMDAIIHPDVPSRGYQPELAVGNEPLMRVIYDGAMMAFFESFLGGAVRHFDYTWLRSVGPGPGTASHCDSVYMGRGTPKLFTAWVPLGDVDFSLGGLVLVEGTNNNTRLKQTYGAQDVDSYCENKPAARSWGKSWGTGGWLKGNPNQIRNSIVGPKGRWLSTEFRAGDALIFTIYTVHASLDNQTADRFRFSSDTRYQLASDPVDERWVGENPIAHGEAGRRGKIC
jgi:hypothetical protein